MSDLSSQSCSCDACAVLRDRRRLHQATQASQLQRKSRGFTLVEVLAALLLIAIVLPVVMRGISAGTSTASLARRRTEAASLAQSKLAEIVATEIWRDGTLNGTFDPSESENAGDYSWQGEMEQWSEDEVKRLTLHVTWTSGAGDQEVILSTLVYDYELPEETEETTSGTETAGAT